MTATRNASTRWTGDLQEGNGVTSFLSSGLPDTPVTWAARTNNPEGKTSPEELIAAAHTSCFSMAFSAALAKAGHTAEEIVTEAAVTFKPGTGITDIALTVNAKIPGLDNDEFQKIAHGAKENCPVSQALKAVPISLEATLG
ncbi:MULTISPECIES: OsmC family protein [Glycomyces]|uniref:OsmC family protein n=2 Tax=Glycomyces TaxID=58113 RepID=A0A9X3PFR3_9ACTN|nr:OsmC family protein [Glycomyces lechevalierae]MDA1383344.1 OsmC family protein [Glycomyces lechevalierae]MDR7336349.1 osmotically inducible protein OsmC [Glycomyces lechevalierae]